MVPHWNKIESKPEKCWNKRHLVVKIFSKNIFSIIRSMFYIITSSSAYGTAIPSHKSTPRIIFLKSSNLINALDLVPLLVTKSFRFLWQIVEVYKRDLTNHWWIEQFHKWECNFRSWISSLDHRSLLDSSKSKRHKMSKIDRLTSRLRLNFEFSRQKKIILSHL